MNSEKIAAAKERIQSFNGDRNKYQQYTQKPEEVSQPLLKELQDRLKLVYEGTNPNGSRPSTAEAVADAIRFMKDDILSAGPKGRKTLELFFGEMLLGLRRSNSSSALHFARVAESLDQVGQRYLYDRILTDATEQNFNSQKNYLTGKYLHSLRKAAPPTPSGGTIRISTLLDSIVAGLGEDITDLEATVVPDSAKAARAEAFKIFMNSKARSLDLDSIEGQPKYIRKLVAMADSYGSLESLGPLVDRLKNTDAIDLVGQALATVSDPKAGWQLLDRAYGPKVAREKFLDFYESAVASKGLYKDADSAQRQIDMLKNMGAADPAVAENSDFKNLAAYEKRNPSFFERCKIGFNKMAGAGR